MQKLNFVLPTAAAFALAAFATGTLAFAQGFDNYVTPQMTQQSGVAPQQAQQGGIGNPSAQQGGMANQPAQQGGMVVQPAVQNGAGRPAAPQNARPQNQSSTPTQGGYVANQQAQSAIVDPPENYNPTKEELAKLDEFLIRWEEHGKKIKRVACNVHMREYDEALRKDSSRPVVHTWGEFKFITPNKLSYHVSGEFDYTDANPEGVWKEAQNEWKVVLDGKSLTQYDFKNKKAIVYQIPEDEQDLDLTMDNGQFPLFFVAKADTLKSRFYLRIVTPKHRQKSEVWIDAYPRYYRDAQQFQSITVLLNLKDLQPSYMRRTGANGKSRTDLAFENVAVNKGIWAIEGTVDPTWTKEVQDEAFSILNQKTIVTENGTVATLVTDPAQFPSSKNQNQQTTPNGARQTRTTNSAQTNSSLKRF